MERVNTLLVVQEVMGHVVACVSKDATTVRGHSSVPVPEDYTVGKLPERRCKSNEKCRRHYEAVLVHWKVVMDTVEEEMEGDSDAVVRKVAASCQYSIRVCEASMLTRPGGKAPCARRIL